MKKHFNYKNILNTAAKNDTAIRHITEEESQKLKSCLYEMAVDLDDRCRKHDIKLFIVGGTLLGAVRHKGFIPWDDDFDFGLMRADYEKLKDVFESDFSDTYELRCPNSGFPNGNRFMQIYRRGTTLKTVGANNPLQPTNVFVDVFPYDYVPETALYRVVKGLIANLTMLIASCVMDNRYISKELKETIIRSREGKLFFAIRTIIGKTFSFKEPIKWFDAVDTIIQNKKTNYLTSATGRRHYFGEIYPVETFQPFTEIKFIDHKFYAPGNWEVYLKGNYGDDYMCIPDETKRESHYITDFSI